MDNASFYDLLLAAEQLVEKLELIDDDPSYTGMCGFLHAHNYTYNGPNYGTEKANLRIVLDRLMQRRGTEVQGEPAEKEDE